MIRVNLTVRTPGDDDSLADLYNDTWICLRGSTLSLILPGSLGIKGLWVEISAHIVPGLRTG